LKKRTKKLLLVEARGGSANALIANVFGFFSKKGLLSLFCHAIRPAAYRPQAP
jgi:hypothetical protein